MRIVIFVLCGNSLFISLWGESGFSVLQKIIPNNPIIVEAGIQYGQDTKKMAIRWPQATIYGFEPHPLYFQKASALLRNFSNITLYPIALSDSCGLHKFYLAGPGSSLLMPAIAGFFPVEIDQYVIVPTTTLDTWAQENAIERVDFLWLALEGYELPVLQAASKLLQSIRVLYIEVNMFNFWQGTTQYHELKQWLEQKKFYEYWRHIVDDLHGNVIFIRM
jgi:FkbM family methyltransferase